MNETGNQKTPQKIFIRFGLAIAMLGLFVFTLGAKPFLFGLDRSPVVGFVQIIVFLIGLAMICLGGYIALNVLWGSRVKTISADIGFRLVATGYVFAVVSGMADVFGFGSQPSPSVPYFGRYQATGVLIGQIMIAIGFLLMIPRPIRKQASKENLTFPEE